MRGFLCLSLCVVCGGGFVMLAKQRIYYSCRNMIIQNKSVYCTSFVFFFSTCAIQSFSIGHILTLGTNTTIVSVNQEK